MEQLDVTKNPTCISTGLLVATCKSCGYKEETVVPVDPEGHDYTEWEDVESKVTATTGVKTRKCNLCNNVDEKEHKHEFSEWNVVKKETCLAVGILESKCEHCNYSIQQEIPSGTHEFTEWKIIKESTCIVKG